LEKRDDTSCFGKQGAKFLIHRGGGPGFVIGASAILRAFQDTAFGKAFEFALKTGWGSLKVFCQFGQKPGFPGRQQRRRQDLLADNREQRVQYG
jgi:hypothetical protein